ncbi:hypothetical protein MMC13_004029 [Lambiella insularis]|nr:hypothetical protein [Lambiella insularis]
MEKKNIEEGAGLQVENLAKAYDDSREANVEDPGRQSGAWKRVSRHSSLLHVLDLSPAPTQFSQDYFDGFDESGLGFSDHETALDKLYNKPSKECSGPLSNISRRPEGPRNHTLQLPTPAASANNDVSKPNTAFSLEQCAMQKPVTGMDDEVRLETSSSLSAAVDNSFLPGINSILPDTGSVFEATNSELDMAKLGLDADLDLLQSSHWVIEHQKIQLYILERSFFWFESGGESRPVFSDQLTLRSNAELLEKYYVQFELPADRHVRILESSWQDFRNTDSLFFHSPSDGLISGRRVRNSKGSIQDCIRAFEVWLSEGGLVSKKAITPMASSHGKGSDTWTCVMSLMKSRNILIPICQSIEYLQRKGICTNELSLFLEERPKVVRLTSIPVERLAALTRLLNLIVGSLSWAMHGAFAIATTSVQLEISKVLPHHLLISVVEEGHFESLSNCSSLGVLAAYWLYLGRVLDLAVISYCSSHLVSVPGEYSLLHQLNPDGVISIRESSSFFVPASLGCLAEFVQGESIWMLCYQGYPINIDTIPTGHSDNLAFASTSRSGIGSAYISASIESLADIWGPIWRLDKSDKQSNGARGYYYALGAGAIGEWSPDKPLPSIAILSDEILCHFVPSRDRMELDLKSLLVKALHEDCS